MKWCLACVLLLAAVLTTSAEDYHPERTLLMDYYPHDQPYNFLFRGNMPIVNGQFAYNQILTSMKTIIAQHNLTFPAANFTLIDVSYLLFEESDLKIEEEFFSANPHVGVFHKKPIIGTFIPPPENTMNIIKDVTKYYEEVSIDKLPKLMEFFKQLVTGQGPAIIYSHCEAGTDRTGEVSGAYYLKFLNMTLPQALAIDNHIQNRDMYTASRNALQWYCFYLKYIEGRTYLECIV